ncbi:hypothetical protein [Lysinibacillus sphaericus]|uniref:hypothetical protein n=1 Tax=Lysinibacillus sphaericus TaxID=1421 RepID=UPI001910A355|nr:hypothetical protein [Lysinibacillus sphaericus]QPA54985.1 hypothetical protein INQ53_02765 [Lysinibacillus sphaericus]QPA60632.1 hypothetical protein INQ55_10015 [Lysinibacillus sphaericus]
MNDLLITVIFSVLGSIISLGILIVFLKKKSNNKDFISVIITFTFLSLICLYLSVTGLIDIVDAKNGNSQSSSGMCKIVKIEDFGRFGGDSFFQIIIDDITVEADAEEFSFLKDGTYECTIQYGEISHRLIDIKFN